ncbi:hypothetical protein GOBAR_AA15008 [Gossypium barbadense]|uniref:Uncharacterized protein n=1 Tax=Gossypium barbadense TaxID=3634 RepID=A0A2P5XQM8_GOSBA|nr:hypothetical protein GOBAR_AA15008 [Gossypium barbadense]
MYMPVVSMIWRKVLGHAYGKSSTFKAVILSASISFPQNWRDAQVNFDRVQGTNTMRRSSGSICIKPIDSQLKCNLDAACVVAEGSMNFAALTRNLDGLLVILIYAWRLIELRRLCFIKFFIS